MGPFRFSLFMLVFVFFHTHAQQTAEVQLHSFPSKILQQTRPLYVYTPWEYLERDLVSFDVVYVFDAQNRELFDVVQASLNYACPKKNFIVVGIASPAYDELDYYRTNDFYPKPINVPLEQYPVAKPHAENFWKYVTQEVMPWVEQHYRTTPDRYLVGHSLSASFVLDKAVHHPENFKGFIGLSPNLAYDNQRLANDLLLLSQQKTTTPKFIFLSQADEPDTWAKAWGEAYRKVKEHFSTNPLTANYTFFIQDFPQYTHQSTVPPAVWDSLQKLSLFINNNPYTLQANPEQVTFRVTVPNPDDEVYITGNQESLGLWNPGRVKFKKVAALERELTVKIQYPIEFKLTRGSWPTEGFTNQTTSQGENIIIHRPGTAVIPLKVLAWADQ
ncbi:alpha/beta hydrolase-fold protein [Flavobacterium sp.]|uniref:alpha/beta hydrolase-fold protein n=1 Tax=Flavobacterium sp. TaxID=239 RepID=UPI00391D8166